MNKINLNIDTAAQRFTPLRGSSSCYCKTHSSRLSLDRSDPQLSADHWSRAAEVAARKSGPQSGRSQKFNSYLTGLIEGDGWISCPSDSNKIKYPKISIAGHKKDLFFFHWLSQKLEYGSVIRGSSPNSIIWEVRDSYGLLDLIERTKNYFRTGKIERMRSLITFLDSSLSWDRASPGIDSSSILTNGWFAGFSDADSNFNVTISPRGRCSPPRINAQWRLEISTFTSNSFSNLDIVSQISKDLETSVLFRTRPAKLKKSKILEYHSFIIAVYSNKQKIILNNYFNKFPLLTAKRNDYEHWLQILELNRLKFETNSSQEKFRLVKKASELKQRMNNNNIHPNWDHLIPISTESYGL